MNGIVESDFTGLEVWKLSHQLMINVYQFIKLLPPEEKYQRGDQLKRSASSISANIAEGYGRYYYLENVAFCRKARGSLYETKSHIIAGRDLGQADKKECENLIVQCDTIRKVFNGYIRYLIKMKVGEKEE